MANILVVDDDVTILETVTAALSNASVRVITADSALGGLQKVHAERVDLILLDLGFPEGVEGFEVLRCLKADPIHRAIPVIVLTGWNTTADKLRGFELGAVDYVTKPFSALELQARVRALLRTKALQDQLTQANRDLERARARPSRDLARRAPPAPVPARRGQSHQPEGRPAHARPGGLQGRCRRQRSRGARCRLLRTFPEYQHTPVIYVTALSDFQCRAKGLVTGANDLIAKPFLILELAVKSLTYVLRSRLQKHGHDDVTRCHDPL